MSRALVIAVVAPSALALALTSPPAALGGGPPGLPGPAPRERAEGYDAGVENARCEGCHADVAAEWRGSMHQRAWTDPVFLAAYALEPLSFCRGCHAPEADPERSPES